MTSALIGFDEVRALDDELLRLTRGAAALRLRAGEALEALARQGGHHELGFSSLEAYARERCERSARWAADSRALARRVAKLPRLREALSRGELGWSVGELVARVAAPETEQWWLERARQVTVRELRRLVREGCPGSISQALNDEPRRRLSVTVDREDAWALEAARLVAERVCGFMSNEEFLNALLAEGLSTLAQRVPASRGRALHDIENLEQRLEAEREAHAAWCAERERWRVEAEARCRRWPPELPAVRFHVAQALPTTVQGLDRELRRLCGELAERDLILGFAAERAHRVELWRRLGFASEEHHARERLGVGLSSLKAKRALAVRSTRLPELATALASGVIGYEAAYLVSRVAKPGTVQAWIARARERTVKHLREEVEAAEVLVRLGCDRQPEPPAEELMEEFFELQRQIASGEGFETSGVNDNAAPSQMSGGRGAKRGREARSERALGRVTFRWRVSADTFRFWRALERVYERVRGVVCTRPASFVAFLCENFCRVWLPAIRQGRLTASGEEPAYFQVYRRDRFQCSSPVCTRRDVTPHHLTYRAHGGDDDDENIASLCVWCHLRGVHEGRLRAAPPASNVFWLIGRPGIIEVQGRTRRAS